MANSLAWISASAVSSCTTIADDDSAGTTPTTIDFGVIGGMIAHQFTAGSSYTLCKVILQLSQGTSTGCTCEMWSDDGADTPLAKIGTGSISVDLSTIGTSQVPISFTGMSASITSGNKFWVVVKSGSGNSGTFVWYCTIDGTFSQKNKSSDNGGASWFGYSTLINFDFTSYQ